MMSIPQWITATIAALPRRHRLLLSGISALLVVLLLLPSEPATASRQSANLDNQQTELEIGKRYDLSLELAQAEATTPLEVSVNTTGSAPTAGPEQQLNWTSHTVRSGDSLARIFDKMGFTPQQLYVLTRDAQAEKMLRRIHPGETLRFARDDNGELAQLTYQLSATETLVVSKEGERYRSDIETKTIESRPSFAFAKITSNFWNAGLEAGLTSQQIMSVADMFGWDIDFALDIREGDEFSLLFERNYVDGEFIGFGKVLAAEFVNRGQVFQAILHDNGQYYTAEGRAMRKSFLRSPVNFTHITSNFNPRRLHPVTGQVRPHNGIDYGAKTGTPVMSAGDGKVIASAYNNLNGHYVFIQHGERYVTKYLHLSKRLVKNGQRVKQGELIGRVGATGRVTGAHLHYEFLVDGVHRNPRTVELPQAESLAGTELPRFRGIAEQRLAALNTNKRIYLAML
nr:peptidoglycan DD-metalloendopeptidase family protein [Pseudidiomarina mangrovi]